MPATRRRPLALATALGCVAAAALAPQASALVVSSDANGLQMREPNNTLNRVKLSLVDAGGPKYRVEMAQFGGRGIEFGPGCRQISTQHGLDIALCDRINPVVSQVSLGPLTDTFTADPTFPDPIHVNDGGLGPDIFSLGAGNDVSTANREDTVLGGAGNDQLTSRGGRVDGGEGNDVLNALPTTFGGVLVGGPGVDTFDGQGGQTIIDSRDGIAEEVRCGPAADRRLGVTAFVDLVDTPSDQALIAGGCRGVDRAPKDEQTAAQLAKSTVKLRGEQATVKVRCTTTSRCTGTVALASGGRTDRESFSIAGNRTAKLRLAARPGAATVRIAERGQQGPRTLHSVVTVAS
jgi:Ca2+-binding RTX toxin-like protein